MDVYHWSLLVCLVGAIAGWVMAERRVMEPKRTFTVHWHITVTPRPSYTMDSNMNVRDGNATRCVPKTPKTYGYRGQK